MGFILTHPTPNSKEATKVVKNVSTKKQENKKSFTFVGVGDNLYHGAMYWYPYQRDGYYNFDSGSLTLAHSQNSQMSFMYGFFFAKFLFFTVVCVVIVI